MVDDQQTEQKIGKIVTPLGENQEKVVKFPSTHKRQAPPPPISTSNEQTPKPPIRKNRKSLTTPTSSLTDSAEATSRILDFNHNESTRKAVTNENDDTAAPVMIISQGKWVKVDGKWIPC